MRYLSLGVAAFLAILMVAPLPARAFQFDSTGGANPDGTARYIDPDEALEPKADQMESKAPNGVMLGSGLFLNGSVSSKSNSSVGVPVMGWTNPQPGRLTH